jgi:hypothetical protein
MQVDFVPRTVASRKPPDRTAMAKADRAAETISIASDTANIMGEGHRDACMAEHNLGPLHLGDIGGQNFEIP